MEPTTVETPDETQVNTALPSELRQFMAANKSEANELMNFVRSQALKIRINTIS